MGLGMLTKLRYIKGYVLYNPYFFWSLFTESDIAKLLEHPYNKYLWDNIPRPFEIIFPKRVHKKDDAVAISTRERQIRHHVSNR